QTMLNQPVEAEKAYRRALENEPQNHAVQLGLALSLLTQFRVSEAAAVGQELVQAQPQNAEAWATLAGIEQSRANIPDAVKAYHRAFELTPDAGRYSRWLAALQYSQDVDAEKLLAAHRKWDELYGRPPRVAGAPPVAATPSARPLRIGFLSANFNRHPIAF